MAESFTIDLSPRTALITGGSRGIGRAAADLLARAGARVAINYVRDEAAANAAVREIRAAGGEAMALAGDVAEPDQARQLVRDVVAAWERLDIVVNNAGIWDEDVAGQGRHRRLGPHLRGQPARRLPRHGRRRPAPREDAAASIVFVSSTAGQRGEARHSAYAASKGALISYTKSLAARARAAGHPGQLRRARLGRHRHDARRRSATRRARREIEKRDPDRPRRVRRGHRGPDPVSRLGSRPPRPGRGPQRQRRERAGGMSPADRRWRGSTAGTAASSPSACS